MLGWPTGLIAALRPVSVVPNEIGHSSDEVFRVRTESGFAYVKHAVGYRRRELFDESRTLLLLDGRVGAPRLLYFEKNPQEAWLAMTEVPGVPSHVLRSDPEARLRALAGALRAVHDLEVPDAASRRLAEVVPLAIDTADAGLVDLDDLDPERRGATATELVADLHATVPLSEDPVFTHGDFCLPNVLVDPEGGAVTGIIDWGRAGIADRYQDLALLHRSFARNFGGVDEQVLCESYGIERLDPERLAFYRLLDEFF